MIGCGEILTMRVSLLSSMQDGAKDHISTMPNLESA